MTVMTALSRRERAALDVLKLLPDGWLVGRACWNPGTRRWAVTAREQHRDHGRAPKTISGIGEDDVAALTDLCIRLDERRRVDKLEAIDRRGRVAFLEGADVQSQTAEGRPLTADELERVTRRYPASVSRENKP